MDNSPDHSNFLGYLNENVKIHFLPPNTISLIQSLDQKGSSTFKAYYLRWTFGQVIDATAGDHAISLAEFGKKDDIKYATENIQATRQKVKGVLYSGNFYLTVQITLQDLNCT